MFITSMKERRDPLTELIGRFDKRKVANAVERTQRGFWKVRRKPLHVCPIRIMLSDDE